MDFSAVSSFFADAWDQVANFFLNTLGLQSAWDWITSLFK